ncbi:MAG: hypothetical protein K2W96_16330, partial [Gemmataceae bacterium]|nr:hypothetical protein [Gemmataceae bacterium]
TAPQASFLLVPASASGKEFGESAHDALPELQLVKVPGQADLMVCREQGGVRPEDLAAMLRSSRAAFAEAAASPPVSPHARFDIHDWTPLDP